MKKIAIIPTLLTLGNAVCGFAAIASVSKIGQINSTAATNDYYLSLGGWLILFAMVFDVLDGYVARLSKSASEFGGQLDSLCDAISFGAAPGFLLLRLGPGWETPRLHQAVSVIATLYMVCAILRLARFNVQNTPDPASHKRFRGLPSPGAAGCIASLAILRAEWAPTVADGNGIPWLGTLVTMVAPFGALVVALLMVSRVPYPHIAKQVFRGRRHFSDFVQLLFAVAIILLMRELTLVLLFWSYGIGFAAWSIIRARLREPAAAQQTSLEKPA